MSDKVLCCDCDHSDLKRICSAPPNVGAIRCTRFSTWVPLFGDVCGEFVYRGLYDVLRRETKNE